MLRTPYIILTSSYNVRLWIFSQILEESKMSTIKDHAETWVPLCSSYYTYTRVATLVYSKLNSRVDWKRSEITSTRSPHRTPTISFYLYFSDSFMIVFRISHFVDLRGNASVPLVAMMSRWIYIGTRIYTYMYSSSNID